MKTGAPPLVLWTAGLFVAIEAVLAGSDLGLLPAGLRESAYETFAFYDLWFEAWRSGQDVPGRFYWSFLTHAFLHGGFLHLAMNTVVFLALGAHMVRAVGSGAAILIFLGTAMIGALTFGLIADTGLRFVPMVGASGAIFGFLGAMKRWEWSYVSYNRLPKTRFWRTMMGLFVANLLLSTGIAGGGVAWEAHLGGFVAGWAIAMTVSPRRGMAIGPI